jgi:hypothetical protein
MIVRVPPGDTASQLVPLIHSGVAVLVLSIFQLIEELPLPTFLILTVLVIPVVPRSISPKSTALGAPSIYKVFLL